MLKVGFIGRGMHLEFRHPDYAQPIVTSRIEDVRELTGPDGMPSSKETTSFPRR
jgi:hypothetical protein